ncbi:MAG: hypothetical protein HC892_09770 [Saprospiraceae bacterium]|nr:hypothetical protein [Saprospiraceae bacterium]
MNYQVIIPAPGVDNPVLTGLENVFDPNGGNDNQGGIVTLTPASPVDLMQDFGYSGDDANTLGSIGNLVWEDLNADGIKDANEAGIEGVTLDLYRDLNGDGQINPGEPRIGTTTTDANGLYLFDELPLGDYVVDVTDEAGLLNGYWHSLGSQDATTNGGNDPMDNSKSDAFAVTIDGTIPDNRNVDFGYYKDPASVGNYVWEDTNANGLQDDGETGINGVQVTLMITYPDGTMSTIVTTTVNDAAGNPGFYEFTNLLLDEDYNGDGAGAEPVHTIKVDANQTVFTSADLVPTTANVNSNGNDLEDSDDFAGVVASPVQGNQNTAAVDPSTGENVVASYDFGVRQVVDLATIIEITSTTPAQGFYDNDDPITFKVTVENQGGQAVSDVTVTNYLPATLENAALVASSLMINGNPAPAGVTITKVGNDYVIDFGTNTANWLESEDLLMFSFTADITDGTTPGTVITNTVEISSFDTDDDSNTDAPTDVDSTPDATDGNTSGEVAPNLVDDQLTGNGQAGNDEDDHDIAVLTSNFVLPVELIAFRAEAKDDHIGLTWTTASELNNDRFEVERSEDAKSFKQIGTVKGKGTTVETTDYSFEDRTAIPGVLYYYRLKQVDTDGTFDYSELRVAQLGGSQNNHEIVLYPNPVGASHKLNVRIYTQNARAEFVVADMQNRVAKVFKLDVPQNGWNIFELDIQDLPSGSYFLTGSEGQLGGFVKTNE